jgi:sugar transferase (PEP-CTERM/EpsH1 system associated)
MTPLIVHVVQRFAIGGMENGLVNLINHMPEERYRHAILCLNTATEFKNRICSKEVPIIELGQTPGHDFAVHWRFWKTLRKLKPDIVHTRNLPALEFQSIAMSAGVKGRIHGEHGRDVYDLDGLNRKYNALRKAMRPFVQHYTAVSKDLEDWLVHTIGIKGQRVTQIYSGVRADTFHPRRGPRNLIGPDGFMPEDSFVVGTVGRMEGVKDQLTLVRAFVHLLKTDSGARQRARLVMIGDGSLRRPAMDLLRSAGLEDLAWLPGERDDIPELMRAMDLFVLPSLREGISNTILEAMATGLPVAATRVGGNPELITENRTGTMIAPSDPIAMSDVILSYLREPNKGAAHGRNGRHRIEPNFTMDAMVDGYLNVYDSVLLGRSKIAPAADAKIAIDRVR